MVHPGSVGVGLDRLQTVAVGLTVVDDHRQPQLLRQLHLGMEDALLEVVGRVFLPVVVQSDLPHGLYLGMAGQGTQAGHGVLGKALAVGGVDPHGGVDKGEALRQLYRRPGAVQVAAWVQDQLHPLARHGGEDLQAVGVEGSGVIVGVGVKQAHKRFLLIQLDCPLEGCYNMGSILHPSKKIKGGRPNVFFGAFS